MKIMTFNTQHCLNFLTKEIDFERMAQVIRESEAEIVGLNEIRGKGVRASYADQTAILAKLANYPHYYFAKATEIGAGNPYGNGLLSKFPFKSVETIPVPDPHPKSGSEYYETRCILKATFENGLTVLVTHFGLNEDEQQNAVATALAQINCEKCLLMGDFNLPPESPILAPIYGKMQDAAAAIAMPLSYPSDQPKIKLDYIFATPDIEIIDAKIPVVIASDHRPHTATIHLPKYCP